MADWLQCNVCGDDVFEPDADGMFWDGTEATCQTCGTMSSIHCDDERAYVSTEEHVEDVGQPRCHNEHNCIYTKNPALVAEFYGAPCRWTCPKAEPFIAALRQSTLLNQRKGENHGA